MTLNRRTRRLFEQQPLFHYSRRSRALSNGPHFSGCSSRAKTTSRMQSAAEATESQKPSIASASRKHVTHTHTTATRIYLCVECGPVIARAPGAVCQRQQAYRYQVAGGRGRRLNGGGRSSRRNGRRAWRSGGAIFRPHHDRGLLMGGVGCVFGGNQERRQRQLWLC